MTRGQVLERVREVVRRSRCDNSDHSPEMQAAMFDVWKELACVHSLDTIRDAEDVPMWARSLAAEAVRVFHRTDEDIPNGDDWYGPDGHLSKCHGVPWPGACDEEE